MGLLFELMYSLVVGSSRAISNGEGVRAPSLGGAVVINRLKQEDHRSDFALISCSVDSGSYVV